MESKYTDLALYGSKNLCATTDNVFFPISEVCDGTVSLGINLDQVAPLVADGTPPLGQNPPTCNPPLYIEVTFEPIMGFLIVSDLRRSFKRLGISPSLSSSPG